MVQKPSHLPDPNQKSNLRLFINTGREMGGKEKTALAPRNQPGQGGQEVLGQGHPFSWLWEGVFGSGFPEGGTAGPRARREGKSWRGMTERAAGRERRAGPVRFSGAAAAALVLGAEKLGSSREAAATFISEGGWVWGCRLRTC